MFPPRRDTIFPHIRPRMTSLGYKIGVGIVLLFRLNVSKSSSTQFGIIDIYEVRCRDLHVDFFKIIGQHGVWAAGSNSTIDFPHIVRRLAHIDLAEILMLRI